MSAFDIAAGIVLLEVVVLVLAAAWVLICEGAQRAEARSYAIEDGPCIEATPLVRPVTPPFDWRRDAPELLGEVSHAG